MLFVVPNDNVVGFSIEFEVNVDDVVVGVKVWVIFGVVLWLSHAKNVCWVNVIERNIINIINSNDGLCLVISSYSIIIIILLYMKIILLCDK